MVIFYIILGCVLGLFLPEYTDLLCYFDLLFLSLLNLIVPYLMFPAMVISIVYIYDNITKDTMLKNVILYYAAGTLFSILFGFGVAFYVQIGNSEDLNNLSSLVDTENNKPSQELSTILLQMMPTNLIKTIYHNNLIQLFIIAYLFGIGICHSRFKKQIMGFLNDLYSFALEMADLMMLLIPYALLSVVIKIFADEGKSFVLFGKLILFILGLYVVRFTIMLLELYFIGGVSPLPFILKSFKYQTVAFISTSSKATLPIAAKDMDKMGVSQKSVQYAISIGSILSMNGFAFMLSVISVFMANIYNVELDLTNSAMIIIISLLGCFMGAGIPGSSVVMLCFIFKSLNIPLDMMPLIVVLDRFMDMFSTLMNITGICSSTTTIDSYMQKLNKDKYNK